MKKIILLALVALAIGCTAPYFNIGMSELEFTKANPSAEVVSADVYGKVYRMRNVDITSEAGYNFYFFSEGKLVKYEQSKRPDGYKYGRM